MILQKSRLEMYVEMYIKQRKGLEKEKNYFSRAKMYIFSMLENPKCDFKEAIYDLYTVNDNTFTAIVYNMLINMDVLANQKSLTRTMDMLDKIIEQ